MRDGSGAGSLPPYSPRMHRWFALYLKRYFRRNFDGVRVSKAGPPPDASDAPLVFYSNHPSWWDPALFMLLGWHYYPGMKGYGPMDAAALEKYSFFRRLGVFPVEQGTLRGARQFLGTSRAIVEHGATSLWVTAGGEFSDPRVRPMRLAPGLSHLAAGMSRGVIVPLALEYPFWNERHPEALARFGEPMRVAETAGMKAADWQEALTEALQGTMDDLAGEAATRDAERFESLLAGEVGVGGIYDSWRRTKAWYQGKSFVASHGDRA